MLAILSSEESASSDQALSDLAQFLGVEAEIVPVGGQLVTAPPRIPRAQEGRLVLAMGSQTLGKVYRQGWFANVLDDSPFVFVYGFVATDGVIPELEWLTDGAYTSVVNAGANEIPFAVQPGGINEGFPVAGQRYTTRSARPQSAGAFFGRTKGAEGSTSITANGNPHFVAIRRGQSVRFLLAEREIISIDQVLSPEQSLRPFYAQLIAVTIFLRLAFGNRCWTSQVTGATMIIDDPYLKARYGFVRYKTLLPELQRIGGALTVAFIPYNYRRSDTRTIELARRFPEQFSIAVHGCDHMAAEYASLDEAWLRGTTACALERMERHSATTLLPFDNIMVFPQGRFSTKALRALSICGVAAAVNTEPRPVDYGDNRLTVRDLLDVAVTRYESFPIFIRRYPKDIFDFAFDALFQKPILAVEHHAYFRGGYLALRGLVRDVSALGSKVKWMPLGACLAASYLLKRTGKGHGTLRHFMPELRIRNPNADELFLAVEKPEQTGRVEAVLIGGREAPFELRLGKLTYELRLRPQEEAAVTIRYRAAPTARQATSLKYRIGVRVRRTLSDLRDNHLARNERILALAIGVKNKLTRGGCPHDDARIP